MHPTYQRTRVHTHIRVGAQTNTMTCAAGRYVPPNRRAPALPEPARSTPVPALPHTLHHFIIFIIISSSSSSAHRQLFAPLARAHSRHRRERMCAHARRSLCVHTHKHATDDDGDDGGDDSDDDDDDDGGLATLCGPLTRMHTRGFKMEPSCPPCLPSCPPCLPSCRPLPAPLVFTGSSLGALPRAAAGPSAAQGQHVQHARQR